MTRMTWIGLAATALIGTQLAAQKPQAAETLLQTAIKKEVVDGDLKGAIEQYKKVAQSGNRPIAAQALLHMAACYQKLGDGEARRVYERIVREFGDQAQVVAAARVQLGSSTGEAATRRIWTATPGADLAYSSASHDGRFFTFIDYNVDNLFVHDLVTGMTRQVTDSAAERTPGDPAWVEPEENAFSRDSKQLAYAWERSKDHRWEVRIVDLTGTGIPRYRSIIQSDQGGWIGPDDWSPDGKWLAVQLFRKDHTYQIALLSAQDGSLRVLKTQTDHRGATRVLFSPDGRYVAFDAHPSQANLHRDVYIMPVDGGAEVPVAVSPSQDVLMGWSPDGSRVIFSSDRTGSTDLWSQAIVNGKPQGSPEFLRRDSGNFWPMRLTSSGSLMASLNNSLGTTIRVADFDFRSGQFLSQPVDPVQEFVGNNLSPAWSPDGKSLAYLSRGRRVLAIRSMETGKVSELDIKMRWVGYDLAWAPDGRAVALTGQDLTERGGIHRVDLETGEVSPLALYSEDHQYWGAVWSPDGSKLYYRDRRPASIAFIERDLATGRERDIIERANLGDLNLSPDGKFIATGSNDAGAKTNSQLLIPVNGGPVKELIRVNQPDSYGCWGWAPDSRSVFLGKEQGQNREVWRAPIDGGALQKLDLKLDPGLGHLRVNPDQRKVAFQVQPPPKPEEVWVTENFLPTTKLGK